MSKLSRQCRILNIKQPYRPPRYVTGIALLFFFYFYISIQSFLTSLSLFQVSPVHIHIFHKLSCVTVCSAQMSCMDKDSVPMEAARYTAEILVSNLLLSAAGRRALKVTGSVTCGSFHSELDWDVIIFHLYCSLIHCLLFIIL
jgi:hypothetical protein